MDKKQVFPDTIYSSPAQAEPESSKGLAASPNLKFSPPSRKKKIIMYFLTYLFLGIQFAQAGLSISTVVIALKEGQKALSSKSSGEYQVVELTFMGEKGYFMPELGSNLSKVNNTYNIKTLEELDDSPLEFCLIFSDPYLVDQTFQKIHDTTSVFYVQIVSIIIVIFDLIDAVKPVFLKIKGLIYKILKVTPNAQNILVSLFLKAMVLGVIASPRYLVLNFTGEDYSQCIGFNDQNPFYVLDHAFFEQVRPGTMNTWKNNSQAVIYQIYQIFLSFLLLYVVGASYPFIPIKNIKYKILKYFMKFVFIVGAVGLILLGMVYLIINWMLIAAQMKENAAVILSILFLSRDFINVFTVSIVGFIEGYWESIQSLVMKIAEAAQSPGIGGDFNGFISGEPNFRAGNLVDKAMEMGGKIKDKAGDMIKDQFTDLEKLGQNLDSLSGKVEGKIDQMMEAPEEKGKAAPKKEGYLKGIANNMVGNLKETVVGDAKDRFKESVNDSLFGKKD